MTSDEMRRDCKYPYVHICECSIASLQRGNSDDKRASLAWDEKRRIPSKLGYAKRCLNEIITHKKDFFFLFFMSCLN